MHQPFAFKTFQFYLVTLVLLLTPSVISRTHSKNNKYFTSSKISDPSSCPLFSCPKILCDLKTKGSQYFCENVKCQGIRVEDCPPGSIYEEGLLMCGCCPGCAKYLSSGEKCQRLPPPPSQSPSCDQSTICPIVTNQCGPGMECALVGIGEFTCSVGSSGDDDGDSPLLGCPNKRALAANGELHWTPICEGDGTFAPKQCKGKYSSGLCFCVNKEGERIFGREKWNQAENMTCACSRKVYELRKSGLIASFHCTSEGNYEALQCDTDSGLCYCVDPQTGKLTGAVLPEVEWRNLPCYTLNVTAGNPEGQYLRRCESDWATAQKLTREAKLHGLNVLSGRTLNCDYDGSYAQVQNMNGRSECVKKDGMLIGNSFQLEVQVPPLDCQCARDEVYAESEEQPFLIDCRSGAGIDRPIGAYAAVSASSLVAPVKYRCVDKDGFFFGNETTERYRCCLLTQCDGQPLDVRQACYSPINDDNSGKVFPCSWWVT